MYQCEALLLINNFRRRRRRRSRSARGVHRSLSLLFNRSIPSSPAILPGPRQSHRSLFARKHSFHISYPLRPNGNTLIEPRRRSHLDCQHCSPVFWQGIEFGWCGCSVVSLLQQSATPLDCLARYITANVDLLAPPTPDWRYLYVYALHRSFPVSRACRFTGLTHSLDACSVSCGAQYITSHL